jgi:micrococcal nuclease
MSLFNTVKWQISIRIVLLIMPTKKTLTPRGWKWKKVAIGGAIVGTLGLGFWSSKAFYTVTEVIDGDTFVTTEKQYIRLDSVNAPELEYCLGKESKAELEKLVLHKKVYLKVSYIDGMRLIASVYTTQGNVGAKMLEKGMATFADKSTQKQPGLLEVSQKAREKGIGVYSNKCTQETNPIAPKCNIKGNIREGVKYYRFPNCYYYNHTTMELYKGDKWFCTEAEAKKEGFTKGGDCK